MDRIVTATLRQPRAAFVVDLIVPPTGPTRFAYMTPEAQRCVGGDAPVKAQLAQAAEWLLAETAAVGCTLDSGWYLKVRS